MKTYKIHLIRHGTTFGNLEGQYIGVTDVDLTTNSIKELKRLKNLGIYPKVDLVFSSPLKRATESAKIIYDKSPIFIENFKDINFGDYEGKTMEELSDDEYFKEWVLGKKERPLNGESFREFVNRLSLGLRQMVEAMMNNNCYSAAAIMHSGAIMALLISSALPRKKALSDWACDAGKGFTIRITPSIYASSGIIEVIDKIDEE